MRLEEWKQGSQTSILTCGDCARAAEVGAAPTGVGDAKLEANYPIGAKEEQTSTESYKDDPPKHNWGEVTQTNDQEVQVTLMTKGKNQIQLMINLSWVDRREGFSREQKSLLIVLCQEFLKLMTVYFQSTMIYQHCQVHEGMSLGSQHWVIMSTF